MIKDSKEELESLIWDYTEYKKLAESLAGSNTSHSQYQHFQSIIQMCDLKIKELRLRL